MSILNTAASSLTVIYNKPVLNSELDILEKKMQDLDFILKMIDDAILSTNNYTVRASICPRLLSLSFKFYGKINCIKGPLIFYLIMLKEIRYMKIYYQIFSDLMKEGNSMRQKYIKSYLS